VIRTKAAQKLVGKRPPATARLIGGLLRCIRISLLCDLRLVSGKLVNFAQICILNREADAALFRPSQDTLAINHRIQRLAFTPFSLKLHGKKRLVAATKIPARV